MSVLMAGNCGATRKGQWNGGGGGKERRDCGISNYVSVKNLRNFKGIPATPIVAKKKREKTLRLEGYLWFFVGVQKVRTEFDFQRRFSYPLFPYTLLPAKSNSVAHFVGNARVCVF